MLTLPGLRGAVVAAILLSSVGSLTSADDPAGAGLPPGTINYRLTMTFRLEQDFTGELFDIPVSTHYESTGSATASKVAVHWCCLTGSRRLEFTTYFVTGRYTGHIGSGHTYVGHDGSGKRRNCQADYRDRFKSGTALLGPPLAIADRGRFEARWQVLEPPRRTEVMTAYFNARCWVRGKWRRVAAWTEPCPADCFVLPVPGRFRIPPNAFGEDFFRKIVDITKTVQETTWTQHFVLEFTKCRNQGAGRCNPVPWPPPRAAGH